MTSRKLSSATKQLIAETPSSELSRTVDLLVRVSVTVTPALEMAIREMNGHIRTRAGDVLSLSLPLQHLDSLAQLDSVLYVEAAEPLYPESRDSHGGE